MLRRLWGRRRGQAPATTPADARPGTALIFLFDRLPPLSREALATALAAVEPIAGGVELEVIVDEPDTAFAHLAFGGHRCRLVGLSAPVPDGTIERTVRVSHWGDEHKQPMLRHTAHVLCFYDGGDDDPVEQLIALHKVGYAWLEHGLLGVLDEDAWNCLPREVVAAQMEPEMLRACREQVPVGIWTGFVKMFRRDGWVWFCTKGHHRFSVSDFACLGQPGEADAIFELFQQLFAYVRSTGAVLNVGHTAQLDTEQHLRFGPITEYHEWLSGPGDTLVVERLGPSD